MCGRARLSSDVSEIKLVFGIPPERPTPNFAPSWNLAPTDPAPVVYSPGVKQQLAAVRDAVRLAGDGPGPCRESGGAVRGPKHVVKTGKRRCSRVPNGGRLLDSIPSATLRDLRDRATDRHAHLFLRAHHRGLEDEVEDLRPRGAHGRSSCMRKAARSMRCRAIMRLPKRCALTSTPRHCRGP